MKEYNYHLTTESTVKEVKVDRIGSTLKKMAKLLHDQGKSVLILAVIILLNSVATVFTFVYLGDVVDKYILKRDGEGLYLVVIQLVVCYIIIFFTGYGQIRLLGKLGQIALFRLREQLFLKLQELPVAFFNSNKAGDIISRLNNDTDNINQLFSGVLVRFAASFFTLIGIIILMIAKNAELSIIPISSGVLLLVLTAALGPILAKLNKRSLEATGNLSGEIQELLSNFKVLVTFDRRGYFKEQFNGFAEKSYKASTSAAISNGLLNPVYDLFSYVGTFATLGVGLYMVTSGQQGLGLVITYLAALNNFYQPLRTISSVWANIQSGLAAWSRIQEILALKTNLEIMPTPASADKTSQVDKFAFELNDVNFGYTKDQHILNHLNLKLNVGKTYAIVGPTGGGKSTLASLLVRLYDPTSGKVILDGQDIRTFTPAMIAEKVGFIMQDPILFSGTLAENVIMGNRELQGISNEELTKIIADLGLTKILNRFPQGLDTNLKGITETLSFGQKQLAAFLRVLLRKPAIIILDEATANIDTITEQLLYEILESLPANTTKIVIAHRLNTIKSADEIIFVNAGEITANLKFKDALELLEKAKRAS